ncbi:hypothetical protein SMACR_04563 [Sordaria macrospora]|uniref:WGS project CABT00000000 data, contig 2.20 n=2 Tax=Sordaria macrospora TaxID=5147 RepID=F7W1U0_SORMK|nr:uncharacterized protein SMAC_04563 [Sordaria macrospora k-hell]KAA8630069.1 hypothetical protein SMACR_04563 [Sordaria macrospora]KAH7631458.1 hypothetical protein B0T09DRAFT_302951 [Sordaria sp. MPI-SDFR-AT-0083]WPJ62783.1 hypothetical protein SMAC4_04563 [Sordaria macrospora]CCC11576.1 unnamed protein product [Sordaria macrospora k-hell]
MDKLPQEVVDAIAAHLFPPLVNREPHRHWFFSNDDDNQTGHNVLSAAPYATISAPWQRAVEALTFHSLTLFNHQDVSDAEQHLRRNDHRRNCVFHLRVDINIDRSTIVEREALWVSYTAETIRGKLYTWRDQQIVHELRRMVEFINLFWPPTTGTDSMSSVPARPLSLLIYFVDIQTSWDRNLEHCPTEAPSNLRELPVCPAVTALEIWYPQNANTVGLWSPCVCSPPCSTSTRVRPTWLLEFGAKFPSVHKKGGLSDTQT